MNSIIFSALVLVFTGVVTGRDCEDCVIHAECPAALDLLQYRDDETIQLFQNAYCGVDATGETKVCCSDFSASSDPVEDTRIANHPNLALLHADCGLPNYNRLPLGGYLSLINPIPWAILIVYSTRDGLAFKCGGSLISSRYVVTSAQCVKDKNIASVRIGEHDFSTNADCNSPECETYAQDVLVEQTVVHNLYSGVPKMANDIALLRLAENVDLARRNVDAVCLPMTARLRDKDLNNKMAKIFGWGTAENTQPTNNPRYETLTIKNCSEVIKKCHHRQDNLDADVHFLCTSSASKHGDTGTALMVEEVHDHFRRYIQYGIYLPGARKCGTDYPAVYTDVRKYMGWILDNITP